MVLEGNQLEPGGRHQHRAAEEEHVNIAVDLSHHYALTAQGTNLLHQVANLKGLAQTPKVRFTRRWAVQFAPLSGLFDSLQTGHHPETSESALPTSKCAQFEHRLAGGG